jgi:hypothetical protein
VVAFDRKSHDPSPVDRLTSRNDPPTTIGRGRRSRAIRTSPRPSPSGASRRTRVLPRSRISRHASRS